MSPEGAVFRSSARTGRTWFRVREIASGGMGRVDLVLRREGSFERLYAMKRLHPHLREDTDAERMFVDEARVAGLLRHPNVVSVIEVDADDEGSFLLMDYVEGVSLSELLRAHQARGVTPPVQLCLRIGAQIARGLSAAHSLTDARGDFLALVHRDVSPQNVIIGFDGLARLTDFGIARAAGRSSHTGEGVLKGKLRYMSPEQLRFEDLDFRSDIFSLGVVLFELLAAERMIPSTSPEVIARAILSEPPRDLADVRSDVPAAVIELLFEMLAKDPAGRPESAAEIGARLDAVVEELIADEQALDVGPYLDTWFGTERDDRRQQITERIRAFATEPQPDPNAERAPSRRRLRWTPTLALVCAMAGAIVVVVVVVLVERRDRATFGAASPAASTHDDVGDPAAAGAIGSPDSPDSAETTPSVGFQLSTPSPTGSVTIGALARPAARPRVRRGPVPQRPSSASGASATTAEAQPPAPAPTGSLFHRWE